MKGMKVGFTKNRSVGKRFAAAASVMAAAAIGLTGLAGVASADSKVDAKELANINWDVDDATITVHKHDQIGDADGKAGMGHELDINNKPIEGVKFQLYKTDLDLENVDNWGILEGLDVDEVLAGKAEDAEGNIISLVDAGTELTTEADGRALFENLTPALYIVEETDNSGAKVDGKPVVLGEMAAPWFMVVPTHGTPKGATEAQWMYDVHAYPKNQVEPLKKTPGEEDGVKIGDELTWDITALMPRVGDDKKLTSYVLTDTLDEKLSYQEVKDVKLENKPLTEGTDYTVAEEDGVITFSLIGDTLAGIKGNEKLTFTIVTIVEEENLIPGGIDNKINGEYENDKDDGKFEVVPTDPEEGGEDGKTGPSAWVAIGNGAFTKVYAEDKDDEETFKALEGAEFQVFPYSEENAAMNCDALIATGKQVTSEVAVSDKNGKVSLPLLRIGDSNGTWDNAAEVQKEFLVCETKAPAGYILDKTTPKTVTYYADPAKAELSQLDFFNAPNAPGGEDNTLPSLPLTGASGTLLFLLVGGGLLAGGVALRMRSKAKQG